MNISTTDLIDLQAAEILQLRFMLEQKDKRIADDDQLKRNLAMLIRMLCAKVKRNSPESDLPLRAMKLLQSHDLQGSPLRYYGDAS